VSGRGDVGGCGLARILRAKQAELREGTVFRHRAMPQIDFSGEDADASVAHLYALAVRK